MVTFIDDDLAILSYAIADNSLPHQALNDGYIQRPGRLSLALAYPTDLFGGQAEKCRQSLDPLLQQLATMYEN
jgi:hypothetical protein